MIAADVFRVLLQNEVGFLFGLIKLTGCEIEAPAVQACVQPVRIKFDRLLQRRVSRFPVVLGQGGLCEFVIGVDEPRIEPQSVSKLNRRVAILLLGHILLAGGKVFHLGALGIARARTDRQNNR